jgi:NADH-quinone oxidoreductase subunit L
MAVLVAAAGIWYAFARLKPAVLVPKAQAAEAHGIERVLEHKYYVDEAYDSAIVKPVVGLSRSVLWRGMDDGLIDGVLVNGSAFLMRGLGWVGARLQSGQVGTYAWVLVIGVLAVLGAFSIT